MLDRANVNHYEFNIKLPFMAAFGLVVPVGSILLEQLIPELWWLRAMVLTVFILFVPGFLALKALDIRPSSLANSIVMALGLSIALVMLLGLLANFILPLVGINDPFSIIPLTAMTTATVAVLAAIVAHRDGEIVYHLPWPTMTLRPYHLYLALMPIITLLGVTVQNSFSINIGLVIALVLICSTIALAGLDKIPREAYSLTIFVASLSLLLHTSLISDFLWGWDINWEYYSASHVIDMGVWDIDGHSIIDSMLSIVILGPILSIMSGLGMDLVLRLVYPFIFSFLPVGLYLLYRTYTNNRIALFSAFFFISLITFFAELPQLARQEIAELFVVLLLLLIADTQIKGFQKNPLFMLFSFSLIVSHYATFYIFLAVVVLGYALSAMLKRRKDSKRAVPDRSPKMEGAGDGTSGFDLKYILWMIFISLGWYASTANATPLLKPINIIDMMFNSILNGVFNGSTIEGISIIGNRSSSLLEEIWIMAQFVFAIAIIVGVIYALRTMKTKGNGIFSFLNPAALLVLGGCMVLPHLANSLNTTRIFHLALMFLAPSLIIGVMWIIGRITRLSRAGSTVQRSAKIMSVAIILSLAFNTGLIHEFTGAGSSSWALDNDYDFPRFSTGEVIGVKWTVLMGPSYVFTDEYRWMLFNSFTADGPIVIHPPAENLPPDTMMYLGKFNLDNHVMHRFSTSISWHDSDVYRIQQAGFKIYANGPSELWYVA